MNKKLLWGLVVGILVIVVAGIWIMGDSETDSTLAQAPPESKNPAASSASMPAGPLAQPTTSTAPQTVAADYSRYLTVEDVKRITGHKFSLTSVDAKKSGKPDLTFSTTDEGHVILTVQVLRGSDYEKYYSNLRCQDYKPMEYAFWGPKTATPENPPRLLGFRKGNSTIIITSHPDAGEWYVNSEMLEKMAEVIASRL